MATVTTNTLWTRYLNSLGYSGSLNDMLVQALRFYSGSDRKSLNDLWNIYLTSEGVRGSSVGTKLYNYLGDKGHTAHSLDTRIRQSLIAGDIFSPVPGVCSITLTHDILALDPSYLPAGIDGQEFSSVPPEGGANTAAASTSINDLKQLPASGVTWMGFRVVSLESGSVGFQLIDSVTEVAVQFTKSTLGDGRAYLLYFDGSGSITASVALPSNSDFQVVGVGADGAVYALDDFGLEVSVADMEIDTGVMPEFPFAGATAFAFVGIASSTSEIPGAVSGEFVTNPAEFPYPPEGEAYDWCGRQIPLLPVYKGGLAQALTDADELDPLEYTSATWSDVESAITAGQLVLDDDDATQLDVNNTIRTITTSINNLVEWTPAEEFSNGEQGVWFDPSDLTTLYQDSNGQTHVTGNGQPVGLMLDKSQGLELGPELITNGDFSDGNAGWIITGSSSERWQIDTGLATLSVGEERSAYIRQEGIAEEGKTYVINFDLVSSGGTGVLFISNGTDNAVAFNLGTISPGRHAAMLKSQGANHSIFQIYGSVDASVQITNISFRELLGHHASQTTTAAKPTYSNVDGLGFDGIDDRLLAGTVDDFIWMHDGSPVTIGIVHEHETNNDLSQIIGTANRGASALIGVNLAYESRDGNSNLEGLACILSAGITGSPVYSYASTATGAGSVPAGQPLTTMLVYDDNEFVTYVNGVQESQANPSAETPFPTGPSAYPLAIGSAGGGQGPMLGSIKTLVIYNKHLTPDAFDRFQHWLAKKAGITL